MKLKEKLRKYIGAYYPIIYIDAYEEIKTDEIIGDLGLEKTIIEWNAADGMVEFESKTPYFSIEEKFTLAQTLAYLNDGDELNERILVLKDAHSFLEADEEVKAQLKRICQRIIKGQIETTIIIVSSVIVVPKEIEKFVTVFQMDDMTHDDIKDFINEYMQTNCLPVNEKLQNELASAFKGLSSYEIESLLNLSRAETGFITHKDLKLIFDQKRQIIMKSNTLEMIEVSENITDIGGLDNLKKWLERKAKIFRSLDEAVKFHVDMPKGVLIVGIPGCGKSLTAKVTAGLFEVPLLKLDIGRIMGKYLGESENNMRKAIKLAENISPCVLWVDELEKGFAGSDGSGHEVTMRLFGEFLTWLQEKKSPVFVVATANDISKLPPEFIRKGRFDDIFYVDLPNEAERRSIFEIHIKRRRPEDISEIDLDVLTEKTKDKKFSGADIESVVVEAVEEAFVSGQNKLTTENIISVINTTRSLNDVMEEKTEALHEYYKKKSNFKSAT